MNRRHIIVLIKTLPEDTAMIDVILEMWRGAERDWLNEAVVLYLCLIHSCLFLDRACCMFVRVSVATHQFVHEIWVGAGGKQLSAGQGLVDK